MHFSRWIVYQDSILSQAKMLETSQDEESTKLSLNYLMESYLINIIMQ